MKYTVRKLVDAFVIYYAEVEAPTPEEATRLAKDDEDKYEWEEDAVNEFDARGFVAVDEDYDEIEGSQRGDF